MAVDICENTTHHWRPQRSLHIRQILLIEGNAISIYNLQLLSCIFSTERSDDCSQNIVKKIYHTRKLSKFPRVALVLYTPDEEFRYTSFYIRQMSGLNLGRFGPGSFRPGRFGPGRFGQFFRVGRFGLRRWVVSALGRFGRESFRPNFNRDRIG